MKLLGLLSLLIPWTVASPPRPFTENGRLQSARYEDPYAFMDDVKNPVIPPVALTKIEGACTRIKR